MSKEQWQKIGGIVITALLAIAAVMGWYFPVEPPEARVRERIAIDARDDAYIYNGADVRWYSDDHSTEIHRVDAAGGAQFSAPTAVPTGTPAVLIDNDGLGVIVEIRDAATPVAQFPDGGGFDLSVGVITMSNDETIGNATDTVIDVSAFFAFAEASVVTLSANGTITAVGSYQPITSTAAVTTSTSTAIANGVKNGQLLVLVNENASDAIVIDDGANTQLGGNKTLTGGEGDAIWLMWDGSDWLCIGYNDN